MQVERALEFGGITYRPKVGKVFKMRVDPVWILCGSCVDPVGIRVRFVGILVFRGVWGHRFLYILGVKAPDRLFPFIKLKGERGPRPGLAAGSAAPWLLVHVILEFYQRLR